MLRGYRGSSYLKLADIEPGEWRKATITHYGSINPNAIWEILVHIWGTYGGIEIAGFVDPEVVLPTP